MNYQEIYNRLISRAIFENRQRLKKTDLNYIYYESHHILPKCLNGTDEKENLVLLTGREHYIAHQLLIKIYPKNYKLLHAAIKMTVNSKNQNRSGNKLYEWLKIQRNNTPTPQYVRNKISQSNKGKIVSVETRKKMSDAQKGKKETPEANAKRSISLKGRVATEQERKNKSKAFKDGYANGCRKPIKHSQETLEKISRALIGKKQSEEHIKKRTAHRKGKPINLSTKKPVICVETRQIFDSSHSAAKFANLKNPPDIHKVCKGKQKKAGGYHWKYV